MAQTETGQVTGSVLDPTGAVVPKATVAIRSISTGLVRQTQSNESGAFIFPSVLPADYELTAEAPGFSKSVRKVVVTVGGKVGVDMHLEIGKAETVVQVSETAGQVNVETQTLGTVISQQSLLELPTLTRSPYSLVATAGNVSDATPDGRGVGYAINGMRAASTNVLLDGSANNDEFGATVGQDVPLDSVQEFSILTNNFTAEFGRASGGVVNVVTKSGTNEFHGSLYEFNRVSALASNNFDNNAWGLPKSTFTRNQYGYAIGGPVKENKLFFFNNIEWIKIRSMARRSTWIATPQLVAAAAANTQEYFSAFGKVRSSMTDLGTYTKDQFLADSFDPCSGGAPNGACASLPGNTPMFERISYAFPADSGGGSPRNEYQMVSRVDYNLSTSTQVYGRVALQDSTWLPGAWTDSPYQGFDTTNLNFNQNYLVSMIHTFSPRFITQSKAVFNRQNNTQPLGDQPPTPTLYMYGTSTARIFGNSVGFPGYLPYSPGTAIPFGGPQNFVQLYQDMNYNRGKHQLRFGGSFNYMRDNRSFAAYLNAVAQLAKSGSFGQGVDNLLTGNLYAFQAAIDPQGKYPCGATVTPDCTVTLPVGPPSFSRSNRYNEGGLYAQDSWKIAPRLTLNLGLRWEYYGVQHNKDPKLDSNFYLGSGSTYEEQVRNGKVMLAPDSPVGGLWGKYYKAFAPRLGFAWDVFGDGKTSLRGGYGIGYERNFGNVTYNVIQNPPNYAVIAVQAGVDMPTIPITNAVSGPLSGSSGTKAIPRVSLRAVKQDITPAYAHFYSLSFERALTNNIVAALEYSGSSGEKLYSIENRNMMGAGNYYLGDPCTPADGDCTSRLIKYGYTNINLRGQLGMSNYNGLNTRVDLKNIHVLGISMLRMNYTWSHAIDNLSDTFSSSYNNYNLGILDPNHPELERANAMFDLRHRVAVSALWDLPMARGSKGVVKQVLGGWQLAPIITAETGAPYSLFECTNAIGYPNGACPYGMFYNKITDPNGHSNGPAVEDGTPNMIKYFDIAAAGPYHDWTNPKVYYSDFGPYPAYMVGRNAFRGPGVWNIDLSVNKNFSIKEKYTIQFRFETYNSFNHANLYANIGYGDTSYDYVPASRGIDTNGNTYNRNVQLALKFMF